MNEQIDSTILWQGKIAFKKFIFATSKYGFVYDDKIVITKNSNPESAILYSIPRETITSIKFPHMGAKEVLLTGVTGFGVWFIQNGKQKRINFWANRFGAIPDDAAMQELTNVMAVYVGKSEEEVAKYATKMSMSRYLLLILSMVFGLIMAGIIGAVIFALAAAGANAINNQKNLHVIIKIILITVLYLVALSISYILSLALLIMLNQYLGTN